MYILVIFLSLFSFPLIENFLELLYFNLGFYIFLVNYSLDLELILINKFDNSIVF